MRDLFAEIQRKSRVIRGAALLLAVYNILRLLIIIGSPYQLAEIRDFDVAHLLTGYQTAFQTYIDRESLERKIDPGLLKLIVVYSGCVAAGFIVAAVFLGMLRRFAKCIVLVLIIAELLMDLVAGVGYAILPGKNSILVAFFFLIFLLSPSISKELR
jgi:hypothetical protein